MFFSKIWFFLVAIFAAVAMTIAVVMPRPAERATISEAKSRLQRACSVTEILLRDNARARIQLAGEFARASDLAPITAAAAKGEVVSGEQNGKAKSVIADLLKETEGAKPDFVMLLDAKGRVVARTGINDSDFGDSMAGYFVVDDALAGYVRDDVWFVDDKLYLIAASPVLTANLNWAGAVLLGHGIDKDFAKTLGDGLQVSISFYMGDSAVASNNPVQVHSDILAAYDKQKSETKKTAGCSEREPASVKAGSTKYSTMLSPLPGEAGMQGAFYAVFAEQPSAIGFSGTFDEVRKDDLSFSQFPWIKLAILFVLIVGVGLGLMVWEADLPLRKLNSEVIELAKNEGTSEEGRERLNEDHRGKFGSIARSVNIVVDKISRDARAAKKDLDQLMGPAPSTKDAAAIAAAALPGMDAVSSKPAPPPPSQFQFSGKPAAPPTPAPKTPPPKPPTPAASLAAGGPAEFDLGIPKPPPSSAGLDLGVPAGLSLPDKPPPPVPGGSIVQRVVDAVSGPMPLPDAQATVAEAPSDELLAAAGKEEEEYQKIFDDFIALKKKCGENTDSLTYEKFSKKLERNRDALISKHGCKSVNFQVYIKDGKAALKASPVK